MKVIDQNVLLEFLRLNIKNNIKIPNLVIHLNLLTKMKKRVMIDNQRKIKNNQKLKKEKVIIIQNNNHNHQKKRRKILLIKKTIDK